MGNRHVSSVRRSANHAAESGESAARPQRAKPLSPRPPRTPRRSVHHEVDETGRGARRSADQLIEIMVFVCRSRRKKRRSAACLSVAIPACGARPRRAASSLRAGVAVAADRHRTSRPCAATAVTPAWPSHRCQSGVRSEDHRAQRNTQSLGRHGAYTRTDLHATISPCVVACG